MFDTVNGRTCLHYAAYYGHFSCLQAILSSAQSSSVAASWFVPFSWIDYEAMLLCFVISFFEFFFELVVGVLFGL